MSFIKATERTPLIGDYYYVKIDTKQDSILKTICEWAKFSNGNYDWDFKGIQHFNGLKEDAEVIEWLDEEIMLETEKRLKKYNELSDKIADCYGKEDESGEWVEHEDNDSDLGTIGEIAARHFGWM